MSPNLNRRDSTASPSSSNDQNQVQFMSSQSNPYPHTSSWMIVQIGISFMELMRQASKLICIPHSTVGQEVY